MNCQISEEYMMRYFDKDINDIEQAQLKQHLKSCKTCNESFENLSKVLKIVEEEGSVEPPENFEACIMEKISAAGSLHKRRVERILFAIYWLATVALGILMFVVLLNAREELLKSLEPTANSSGVMTVIYFIVQKFYGALDLVMDGFTKISSVFSSLYIYLAAVLTVAYMITKPGIFKSKNKHINRQQTAGNR
jgi:hypothetical protein